MSSSLGFNLDDLPFDVLAADLDSDGDQDLLVLLSPNNGTGQVRVFTNSGTGTFVGAGTLAVGKLPWTMVLADFDGINGDDLAVTNLLDHTVSLFSANSATNAGFTAESLRNFLWVTFTRSNPSHDISGVSSFVEQKHWGCRKSLIIDARLKPHHAPPLVEEPAVSKRVAAMASKGKSLHGIL